MSIQTLLGSVIQYICLFFFFNLKNSDFSKHLTPWLSNKGLGIYSSYHTYLDVYKDERKILGQMLIGDLEEAIEHHNN